MGVTLIIIGSIGLRRVQRDRHVFILLLFLIRRSPWTKLMAIPLNFHLGSLVEAPPAESGRPRSWSEEPHTRTAPGAV